MSEEKAYYVYALKDPRSNPARAFYVGKGVGSRAYDHLVRPDGTRKGDMIREIEQGANHVLVSKLVEGLTENQALKLETELISSMGTIETGGFLTNSVVPSGLGSKRRAGVTVPLGVIEKAQLGLTLLKDAVLELTKANENSVTNADVAGLLGLRSDYGGGSKDYLSYSLLGLLIRDGKVKRLAASRRHVASTR